jgi:predicted outer membrane repeat protein
MGSWVLSTVRNFFRAAASSQQSHMRLLRFLVVPCAVVAQRLCAPSTKISVSSEKGAVALVAAANCTGAISAVWSGSVQLTTTIVVGKGTSLTITGTGAAVIDGAGATQLFDVQGGTLILKDLTLSNAYSPYFGAAVNGSVEAQLEAYNTTFQYNSADSNGGAIACVRGCSLLLNNCTFDSNSAIQGGGSVFLIGTSTLDVSGTVFTNSTSTNGGSILIAVNSRINVNRTIFLHNKADFGSAINLVDADAAANVDNSTFSGNVATRSGGAIYSGSKDLNISTSVFNDNIADFGGAVLCSDDTSTLFVSNNFSNNQAKTRYGGTCASTSTCLATQCFRMFASS